MTRLARMLADESGATMVEYALITATLSVMLIGALTAIAAKCSTRLTGTNSALTGLGTSPP